MSDSILGTGHTMPKIHCNHNESCLLLSECCRELQYTNLERYNLRKNNAFILEIYTETTNIGCIREGTVEQERGTSAFFNNSIKEWNYERQAQEINKECAGSGKQNQKWKVGSTGSDDGADHEGVDCSNVMTKCLCCVDESGYSHKTSKEPLGGPMSSRTRKQIRANKVMRLIN